jgi:hypothetical protein
MSKTKRTGHSARLAALEKDLRRLRAQLPKEIHHAVRTEIRVALTEQEPERGGGHIIPNGMRVPAGRAEAFGLAQVKPHTIGSDTYSKREA